MATASINPKIIEGLYCEALVLADEVRAAFSQSGRIDAVSEADEARLALSCEGLRTTTRMMHSLAWLLNHRAYIAGELSEFHLQSYGKLSSIPDSNPRRLSLLDPKIQSLIQATERFHARLKRIDQGWRDHDSSSLSPIIALKARLSLIASH